MQELARHFEVDIKLEADHVTGRGPASATHFLTVTDDDAFSAPGHWVALEIGIRRLCRLHVFAHEFSISLAASPLQPAPARPKPWCLQQGRDDGCFAHASGWTRTIYIGLSKGTTHFAITYVTAEFDGFVALVL
jgi:hypothetical protein